MSEYQGEERRSKTTDHDLLTKIDANLSNFIDRFNDHVKNDEASFKEIRDGMDGVKKYVYIGLGGVLVLEFVFKLVQNKYLN